MNFTVCESVPTVVPKVNTVLPVWSMMFGVVNPANM